MIFKRKYVLGGALLSAAATLSYTYELLAIRRIVPGHSIFMQGDGPSAHPTLAGVMVISGAGPALLIGLFLIFFLLDQKRDTRS